MTRHRCLDFHVILTTPSTSTSPSPAVPCLSSRATTTCSKLMRDDDPVGVSLRAAHPTFRVLTPPDFIAIAEAEI